MPRDDWSKARARDHARRASLEFATGQVSSYEYVWADSDSNDDIPCDCPPRTRLERTRKKSTAIIATPSTSQKKPSIPKACPPASKKDSPITGKSSSAKLNITHAANALSFVTNCFRLLKAGAPDVEQRIKKDFKACSDYTRRIVIQQLTGKLKEATQTQRLSAANVLYILGYIEPATDELIKSLSDRSYEVRCLADKAIRRFGADARCARATIIKATKDKDHIVRSWAAKAL